MRQLKYQVCYTRYQVYLHLWTESVLKYCEFLKYYDQDCLKIFFLLSTLQMMIEISGKGAHLAQKLPTTKLESFSKSHFWPKSNMQNGAYTKPLNLEL